MGGNEGMASLQQTRQAPWTLTLVHNDRHSLYLIHTALLRVSYSSHFLVRARSFAVLSPRRLEAPLPAYASTLLPFLSFFATPLAAAELNPCADPNLTSLLPHDPTLWK